MQVNIKLVSYQDYTEMHGQQNIKKYPTYTTCKIKTLY